MSREPSLVYVEMKDQIFQYRFSFYGALLCFLFALYTGFRQEIKTIELEAYNYQITSYLNQCLDLRP